MVLDMIELRHETYKKTIKLNTSAKTVKIEYFPQKSNQLRNSTTKTQLTFSIYTKEILSLFFDCRCQKPLINLNTNNMSPENHIIWLPICLDIRAFKTCKGHDTVVNLSAGDDMRPAEAK